MVLQDLKELGWAIIWPVYKPIAYRILLEERKRKTRERQERRLRKQVYEARMAARPAPSQSRVWSTDRRKASFDDVRDYYNKYRTICNITGEDFLAPEIYVVKAKDHGWRFLEKSVDRRTTFSDLMNFGG